MRKILLLLFSGLLISCNESPKFQLLSSKHTGIDFINEIVENDSINVMKYEYVYNGAGTGIGDLNNDGLQDIVFAGNQVSPRIYLNKGNFKFKDITSNFPGLTNDQWFNGVTIADVNCDRWPDIYFTATESKDPLKRRNRLWINSGVVNGKDPSFTEMAEKYGIADTSQSINAEFFDYDLDGYLDLYILNNTVSQRMNTAYRQKMIDGSASNNDKLYHNNGNGTFSDVTKQAGIVIEGFGLGLAIGDVNKDGYPDIYVSNDFISNDLLYINQGDGTFRNEISKYLSYQSKSSMGDDMADINNDGNPDIFSLDMFPENYYKKKQTINGFSYMFYMLDEKFNFEHQFLRNMLHLHNGFLNGEMLPYSEVGQMLGIYQSDWSWSPLFADYDNDGDKDLIISNGFPRDMTDKDWTKFKVKAEGSFASNDILIDMAPAVKIPNLAFENMGDLRFIKRSDWLPQIPTFSYGSAFVDLDNDGDLDYVINNIDDQAFILKNNTVEKSKKHSNYLRIRLIGEGSNTMGIGAKVELWENGNYQFIENFLTRGYASCVDPISHFGLANASIVDSIRVTWPASRKVSVIKNVNVNQIIDVDEMAALQLKDEVNSTDKDNLLFRKCDNVINYLHEQNDFIDFALNQKVIPHKFSQIGPRMARGDIDNDGMEDLIIGSTNILPTTVFLRKGTGFVNTNFKGLTSVKEFSEADLAIVDIDGDGDNDVIALAGGYENKEEKEYQHYLYVNNNGIFSRTPLPIPQFPASVVRPFDYDHDGDLDLFVGSRVKKGMYPYANHSWIIKNDDGLFSVDSTSRLNLGMVTDAIWTDYDKDGWEDLLVAREWNSIVIMKNMDGKKLLPLIEPTLEAKLGIWFSIVAGDFDQDGDDDYIAGNLGDNHRFTVSDIYPLSLYTIDIEMDGTIDPLITAYWNDQNGQMTEYPVNYLDELWSQSKLFVARFTDYAQFSYVGFKEMLPENIMKRLEFKLEANTTSSYIIWNDKSEFRWEELPRSVQVAPIKKMIVQDFNGDNWPDVLLAGNDYSYDLATGYFDANKGIVLLNKGEKAKEGQGTFNILTPPKTGMLLQGMVESLLYFKGDKPIIVAGFNRSAVSVFEQTK
ncbi:MAG TPA: VCBS repeat-containing protein [Bacteroidales bacterium]|nr:VCBS repeat-containing protein [Bacteroidales bacterium]